MWAVIGSVLALSQPSDAWLPAPTGSGYRMLLASAIVLGLLGLWAWLMRRGVFARRTGGPVTIETAVPLGDRRSLVIVTIEGRRLLLGLTPASVSLVTPLEPKTQTFNDSLTRAGDDPVEAA